MTNDSVLVGIAVLERCVPFLKIGTRESVSRIALQRVQDGIQKCIEKISGQITNTEVLTPLMEVDMLITSLFEDSAFVEADVEIKHVMTTTLMPAVDLLYLEVGKYYMNNDFTFKVGLESLLRRIVDKCIEQNFYFGYEDTVN